MKQKVFVFWNPNRIEKADPMHFLTLSRLTVAFEKWATKKTGAGTSTAEFLSPCRVTRSADPADELRGDPATPKRAPAPAAPPRRGRSLRFQASCPPDMM